MVPAHGICSLATSANARVLRARLSIETRKLCGVPKYTHQRWVWTVPTCLTARPHTWRLEAYRGEQLCFVFLVPDRLIQPRRTIEHRVLTRQRRHRNWLAAYAVDRSGIENDRSAD